jgi:hypothetical protein
VRPLALQVRVGDEQQGPAKKGEREKIV